MLTKVAMKYFCFFTNLNTVKYKMPLFFLLQALLSTTANPKSGKKKKKKAEKIENDLAMPIEVEGKV